MFHELLKESARDSAFGARKRQQCEHLRAEAAMVDDREIALYWRRRAEAERGKPTTGLLDRWIEEELAKPIPDGALHREHLADAARELVRRDVDAVTAEELLVLLAGSLRLAPSDVEKILRSIARAP